MSQIIFYEANYFVIHNKKYSVEWFKKEYLINRKNPKYFAEIFGIKQRNIHSIASHYSLNRGLSPLKLNKDSFSVKGQVYTKEWLYEEFIIKDRSAEDLWKEIGVNRDSFFKICKFYNISKNKEKKIVFFEDHFIVSGKTFLLKDFLKEYIEDSNNTTKARSILGLSRNDFEEVIKYYNITKNTPQREATRKKTIKEKYGVEYLLQNKEIKKKKEETCLSKWGDTQPLRSSVYKEKKLEELGFYYQQQKNVSNSEIWKEDSVFIDFLKNNTMDTFELAKFFNVDPSVIRDRAVKLNVQDLVKQLGGKSKYEDEIVEILIKECGIKKEQIKRHIRHGIFPDAREVDIYIPDYKFGIEFNGNYWHCDLQLKFQDHGGRSRMHQQKSLDAEKSGVFIFNIFEYEWLDLDNKEKIVKRIKHILKKDYSHKIPAKKCVVKEISVEEKKKFLNQNHIQGNDRSKIALGLFYGDELVACMTFVSPKTKKYTWELSRFCCKKEYTIQGAASKLFKYFLTNFCLDNTTIVSYNDIGKTTGKIYELLGFRLQSINPPNYIWINFSTGDIRTRYQEQKGGEKERMHSLGYHRICDCGTKTWVYVKGE